jgi:hypothetical protein
MGWPPTYLQHPGDTRARQRPLRACSIVGAVTASVVVTFKDEGPGDGPGRRDTGRATPEVAAAIAAGMPFAHDPSNATNLGWISRQQASTIAALHGVELAEW